MLFLHHIGHTKKKRALSKNHTTRPITHHRYSTKTQNGLLGCDTCAMTDFGVDQKNRGDARIELATSCTQSRNHTTRPITQFNKDRVR